MKKAIYHGITKSYTSGANAPKIAIGKPKNVRPLKDNFGGAF